MKGDRSKPDKNAAGGCKEGSADHKRAHTPGTDQGRGPPGPNDPQPARKPRPTRHRPRLQNLGAIVSGPTSGEPPGSPTGGRPPDPPDYGHDPEDLTGDMMAAFLIGGFPRSGELDIFTDEENLLRATVPHHATYYVPDSVGADSSEQYRAGPGSEGHPGLHELALSVMAYYLPAGFEDDPPIVLRTRRPRPGPVKVSRTSWDLHIAFAEEVLPRVDPDEAAVPARELYEWVVSKRPDLEYLLHEDPTSDPFDGLF